MENRADYMHRMTCQECQTYLGTVITCTIHPPDAYYYCNLCSLSAAQLQAALGTTYLLNSFNLPIKPSQVLGFSSNEQSADAKRRAERWAFLKTFEQLRLGVTNYDSD